MKLTPYGANMNTVEFNVDIFNGGEFGHDLNPMQKGKVLAALSKTMDFPHMGIMTVRQYLETLANRGHLEISTIEEDKIKPLSRTRFNRMTGEEQRRHDARVKESGKKTTFLVNGYDMGKIAYDYARFLKSSGTITEDRES